MTFETGRPGVFGSGDVRIGAATVVEAIAEGRRAAYAVDAYLGNDLEAIRTRQTLAEPQPEFLSIVPFTSEVKEPRYRTAMRLVRQGLRRVRTVTTPEEAMAKIDALPPCTCEAIGFCDLRRLGIEYDDAQDAGAPVPPGRRLPQRHREPFHRHNHDYIRDDSHAFILREPSRCIDCGRCASVCAEVVGLPATTSCGSASTRSSTPLDMSLNDTPCVSCGRCAETCPTGALMPKPRVLEKYEVDESRCILCGICVDAARTTRSATAPTSSSPRPAANSR